MANVPRLTQDMPTVASAAPSRNPEAWLKQLESAQWQQRLRYQSQGDQAPVLAQHSNLQNESLTSAKKNEGFSHRSPLHNQTQPEVVHSASGRQAGVASRAVLVQARGETQGNPLTQSPSNILPNSSATAGEPDFLLPLQRRHVHANWNPTHAHAMLEADEVKLWLRDARLQSSEGLRLLKSLRRHFARLGLRLAQLTLNGTRIVETELLDNDLIRGDDHGG